MKNKKKKYFTETVIVSFIIACAGVVCLFFQLRLYENGMVSILADMQDEYLKLVIDQINLKENKEDEKIINDILYTLDSSTNKYWSFSKGETVLFVKDVMETNKYKGVTAATYFNTDSSREFYQLLSTDNIVHRNIQLNDAEYIASGTVFTCNDSDYRLILLSNKGTLLDNNDYLRGKIELYICYIVLFAILVLIACITAFRLDAETKSMEDSQKTIATMNKALIKMNKNTYGTDAQMLWDMQMLDAFVKVLKMKNVTSALYCLLKFSTLQKKQEFVTIRLPSYLRKILFFDKDDTSVIALGIKMDMEQFQKTFEDIPHSEIKVYDLK